MSEYASDEVIERALVRIRRAQQARRLQHRSASDDPAGTSTVNAARFRYLDALEDASDGLVISEIADALGIDRPRASRLTTELTEAGYIKRDNVPGDARYTRIRLARQGKQLVDRVHQTRRRSVNQALTGFTTKEAEAFAAFLKRFVDAWPRQPQ